MASVIMNWWMNMHGGGSAVVISPTPPGANITDASSNSITDASSDPITDGS